MSTHSTRISRNLAFPNFSKPKGSKPVISVKRGDKVDDVEVLTPVVAIFHS